MEKIGERESGDGQEIPAIKKVDKNFQGSKTTQKSEKLERITKKIQKTWLEKHRNRKYSGAGKLITGNNAEIVLPVKLPEKGKRMIQLIPRILEAEKKKSVKGKEPRFVPLEPYKCAMKPMKPKKEGKVEGGGGGKGKNNMELSVLVEQMKKTVELKAAGEPTFNQENSLKDALTLQRENYELQLSELRKEKSLIENQLKFQAQVNAELKNLLVSAVSDESFVSDKITSMTEDKLHLAKKLLNTAEDLSDRTEMLEYYAGQIEVWRSKFLSSSYIVEELARWKTSLTQRNLLLSRSNKKLMENMSRLREIQVEILTNLAFLEPSGAAEKKLETANALDLAMENLSLSQNLVLKSNKVGMPEVLSLGGLEVMTEAEKLGAKALETANEGLISTDELLKAVMGQTYCRKVQEETEDLKQ